MYSDDLYIYGDQDVEVPAHLNFGKYILDRLRLKNDEIALEHFETRETLTYKQFTQYAVNMSVALTKLGVGRGDIVAVGSEKRNEFVPTVLAIVFTGATYTPYDLKSGRAPLKHKITITKPKYFICSNHFWNTYNDILKEFDCIEIFITLDDSIDSIISIKTLVTKDVDVNKFEPLQVQGQIDTAFILYSSGTTGMPKGVQLTHLNCILNSLPNDFSDESLQTCFVFGEWYHNYDTFMTYKFLAMGRKIIYIDEAVPKAFLKCIDNCHINIAFVVPSFVSYLSKVDMTEKFNVDSLKVIYSRSSPLHNKTMDEVKRRFPNLKYILQGYGMTEAGELTSESWGLKGPKSGSVGMASPGITLKVVDATTRQTLGPNQRGEICLRGPVFMKGYIGIDPSTYSDEQGFFKTGDLGYYDDDKYFYIVERLKEIIVYDGYKVAPLELETILQLHPGVREAGVVGRPVPDYGEEPTAFVVKQSEVEITEKDLMDYVAAEHGHITQTDYRQGNCLIVSSKGTKFRYVQFIVLVCCNQYNVAAALGFDMHRQYMAEFHYYSEMEGRQTHHFPSHVMSTFQNINLQFTAELRIFIRHVFRLETSHPHDGPASNAHQLCGKYQVNVLEGAHHVRVPPFMQLRGGIKFIEEMPRNPRGKILRQRLREMLK